MPKSATDFKIARKLSLIYIISLTGIVITLLLFYSGFKRSIFQEKYSQTKSLSDTALAVVEHFHSLAKEGEISTAQAKQSALQTIKAMKFNQLGYYWINDSQGILQMHPFMPKLVETDVRPLQDKNGIFMFQEFIEMAKGSGGGFVEYYWPKPSAISDSGNTNESYPKISYVTYFSEWDWIVGTGIYVDDAKKEVFNYALRAIGIVIAFTVIYTLISLYFVKRLVKHLNNLAIKDSLTNLFTRRFLNENLTNLEAKIKRNADSVLSVIFMDIDHFKNVNDTYGHAMGDLVIATTAEIILNASRPDDLCIRYGGEEFAIITFSENRETARLLAERIRRKMNSQIFRNDNGGFKVTLSAGIANNLQDEDISATIDRADQYLYLAKERGRNQVVMNEEVPKLSIVR